jgi:hypothetical protein
MPDPAESWSLDITASGQHAYDVTITHPSRATTTHSVTVPEAMLAELGLSAAQEPILVRQSLAYLLEHHPAAIPDRFDLDEVGRAIPDFHADILDRM